MSYVLLISVSPRICIWVYMVILCFCAGGPTFSVSAFSHPGFTPHALACRDKNLAELIDLRRRTAYTNSHQMSSSRVLGFYLSSSGFLASNPQSNFLISIRLISISGLGLWQLERILSILLFVSMIAAPFRLCLTLSQTDSSLHMHNFFCPEFPAHIYYLILHYQFQVGGKHGVTVGWSTIRADRAAPKLLPQTSLRANLSLHC